MAAYTTIDDPSAYFKVQLYTGNGSTQAITFDDTDTDMQPDFVWLKNRNSSGHDHFLFDSVNGVQRFLSSNDNGALASSDSSYLTAFNSDGFTLGSSDGMNENNITFVSWNWKAGTSFTNDASSTGVGSIDSSGSVSDVAGFSLCTYTGTGSNATIKHGLSSAPHVVWTKQLNTAQKWITYNKSLGATNTLHLDTAEAIQDNSAFNDTDPTTSVFSVGTIVNSNESGGSYIAYSFAPVQGYFATGKYVGNGNADGPYVHCGFRPALILGRNTTASQHWFMVDNKRSPYNGDSKWLKADASDNELTNLVNPDFTANGFKIRSSNDIYNDSGETHVWMAWAESPFVNSNGIPNNAK